MERVEYKGEIYGRIWEAIIWNPEEKEYQRLSNLLFMAAKEDIIAERQLNHGKYTRRTDEKHPLYIENLKKIINEILPEANQSDKDDLRIKLTKNYLELKNNLNDVRVLGVGNSTVEKCAKACKILLKTMAGTAVAIISTGGPSLLGAIAASPFAAMTFAGLIGFAGKKSVELGLNRHNLKEDLKSDAFVKSLVDKNRANGIKSKSR